VDAGDEKASIESEDKATRNPFLKMESINLPALGDEQRRLAQRLDTNDGFQEIETIAGCDVSYTGTTQITVIVVCDIKTMKIRESKYSIGRSPFPHIQGFSSFRDAPSLVETYHKLELDPDVLIVDGNGILHPRMLGTASHFGLLVDKPTVGIAKDLEWGEVRGDSIYIEKDVVGKVLGTKELAKPIYVSPGHKMSLKSALEIAKETLRAHKLPEPLHQAHKLAAKLRNRIKKEARSHSEGDG
jgi:deoxyribonuclease V